MEYRREIDGLRALAVLPVLFFHAGFPAFRGGFVGVDVFFVISGYLITGILRGELEGGRFSLRGFYERRARRILPALFLVAFACVPFAWRWMMPSQLQDFSQSLVAVSVFSANLFFLLKSGYFQPASELSPLLHTWSLAVEEQYYLVFPLLLAALWRFGVATALVAIGAIAVASLATAVAMSVSSPTANFFLATGRAWELMIGALLAFAPKRSRPRRWTNDLAAGLGLLAICISIWSFDSSTPFPSLWTLVPTLGTAAILYFASSATRVGQLLGARALVGVGLISYSTYLWHQPLFAFARIRSLDEPGAGVFLTLCLVALGLGYLSWRFVERPFRNRQRVTSRQVLAASVCGTAALAALGMTGHWTGGFAAAKYASAGPLFERFDRNLRELQERRHEIWPRLLEAADAPFSPSPAGRRVLVVGDSLADDLLVALELSRDRFPGDEFRRLRLDDLCMGGRTEGAEAASHACQEEFEAFWESPLSRQADLVLISAGWERASASQLDRLLEALPGRPTVVFGSAAFAEMDSFLFHIANRSIPEAQWPRLFAEHMHEPSRAASQTLRPVAQRHAARFVDKYEVFCERPQSEARRCQLMAESALPLLFDQSHVTVEGALRFGAAIADRKWLEPNGFERAGESIAPGGGGTGRRREGR